MIVNNYLNINAYHERSLINSYTRKQISIEDLLEIFPPSIAKLELSREKEIEIPKPVFEIYNKFRPTPLFRAINMEKGIGTNCEIYVKDEGATLTGNHKVNSAYLIAYLCKQDGIEKIATETTGNWGIALSMAAKEYELETYCFIDDESNKERQDRKTIMENYGAKVVVVKPFNKKVIKDYLTLSADAAIKYTQNMKNTSYIFGSIYGYFIIPQSIIGLEAKIQMNKLGRYPDIVIGSCGGGANLLGISAAFIIDYLEHAKNIDIFAAEAEGTPILTHGKMGYYSIDSLKYFPLLYTYGLENIRGNTYIGGLGSTVVASAAAYFHSHGIIQAGAFTAKQAIEAANIFHEYEGEWIALESSYAMAAAIQKAKTNNNKIILLNVSSGDSDRHFYSGENRQY